VEADVQVLVGPVVEQILGVADEANLLVLGARVASAVKSALLGSTATRLLTKCDRPMLVVKQDEPDPYARILVPIDLHDDAMITLRATVALAPRAQVHVLHAYQVEHEGGLRRAGVDRTTLQKHRQSARARVQARFHQVLARAEQGTHRFLPYLRRAQPVRLILETETRFRADLVVMSKRSRSRIEDAILGSTTKAVVLDSHSDVLVVPLVQRAVR
jgi:nucleotide-binding universal stress UspA family protein